MILKRIWIGCLVVLAGTMASCNSHVVLDENIKLPDHRWEANNVIKLEVDITDTVTPYSISFNVRNAGTYSYSNLFLFVNTYAPDGAFARDTVELTLADERGQWLGDGLGDIWDNRLLFKPHFRFPHSGRYRFELEQAMRINPLPGIMDVGMRIEKEN